MAHADLLELPLFADIPLDHLASFLSYWQPQAYAAQTFFQQPQQQAEANHLYLLVRGTVLLCAPGKQPTLILSQLQGPALIGAVEFCCNTAPLLDAQAATNIEVFFLSKRTFEHLRSQGHPALLPFLLQLLQITCAQLAMATDLISQTCPQATLDTLRERWFAQQRSWVAEIFAQSQF